MFALVQQDTLVSTVKLRRVPAHHAKIVEYARTLEALTNAIVHPDTVELTAKSRHAVAHHVSMEEHVPMLDLLINVLALLGTQAQIVK